MSASSSCFTFNNTCKHVYKWIFIIIYVSVQLKKISNACDWKKNGIWLMKSEWIDSFTSLNHLQILSYFVNIRIIYRCHDKTRVVGSCTWGCCWMYDTLNGQSGYVVESSECSSNKIVTSFCDPHYIEKCHDNIRTDSREHVIKVFFTWKIVCIM